MSALAAGFVGAALFAAVLALAFGCAVLAFPRLTVQVLMRLTAALAVWYARDKGEKYGGS